MIVIERPRQSGKTTILLHYMAVDSSAIYVTRLEEYAKRAFQLSQELGLKLDRDRFFSMAGFLPKLYHNPGIKILVDDADYIIKRHFELGLRLIKQADIVTIVEE